MAPAVTLHYWNGGKESEDPLTTEGDFRCVTGRHGAIEAETDSNLLPTHIGNWTRLIPDEAGKVYLNGEPVQVLKIEKDQEGWFVR